MAGSERLLLIAPALLKRTPAFDRAACLAKAQSAVLHIIAFDYVDGLAIGGLVDETAVDEMRQGYMRGHRDWLREQARGIEHFGIEVTTEVVWVQRPFEEMLAHIRDIKPTMVIKDLQHEPWLKRTFFTTQDMRLLYDCPVPLHLVAHVQHGLPRKIVAAIDPFRLEDQYEDMNERIMSAADILAKQCNAELHALVAFDPSYICGLDGGFSYAPSMIDMLYQTENEAFGTLADRFAVAQERRHLITGHPARVIESFMSDADIDVVVMGTVHRTVMNKLLGSTTEQLAQHLPSSLLTINPRTLSGKV